MALIEQLMQELGDNEDADILIDWVCDAWDTLTMLREYFDEARALQILTASAPLLQASELEKVLV